MNLGSSCTPVDDIQCSTLGWLGEAFSYLWDMDVRSTVSAPKVFPGGRGMDKVKWWDESKNSGGNRDLKTLFYF